MAYQSQLNNLMQMATIEQLNMLMNSNSNSNNNNKKEDSLGKDVLNLPIVQRVVAAYEDEIKAKDKASITTSCKCANYEHQFALILAKLDAQTLAQDKALAQVLSKLEEIHASTKKLDVWSINDNPIVQESESYTVTLPREEVVEEEVVEEEYQFADAEEEVEVEVEVRPYKCEQHITLDIEELINVEIQSIVLSEAEDEVIEEVIEEEEVEMEEVKVEVEAIKVEVEEVEVEVEVEEESEVEVESEEEVLSEVVEEVLSEVVVEEEEEEEAEVFEIEIDDISYFATDEENGILYEVDSDGEVGKQVGIIKDGEPIFS
jgi:hypothetical protein